MMVDPCIDPKFQEARKNESSAKKAVIGAAIIREPPRCGYGRHVF